MKAGDVLVEKYPNLIFYTIITNPVSGRGIRLSVDRDGALYDITTAAYVTAEQGTVLALPADMPVKVPKSAAKKEAANA